METYYSLLGVPENASKKDIREAYIKKAKQSHPDAAASPEEIERMNEAFIQINRAYQILKDENKRQEYNAYLKQKRNDHESYARKVRASSDKSHTSLRRGTGAPNRPTSSGNVRRPSNDVRSESGNVRRRSGSDIKERRSPSGSIKRPTGAPESSISLGARMRAASRSSSRPAQERRPSSPGMREDQRQPAGASSGTGDSKETAQQQFEQVRRLMHSGSMSKAREKLRWVIKLDPQNAIYHSYYAYVVAHLKTNLREGLQHLEKAILLEPENPLHYYHKGLLMEAADKRETALEYFTKALKLDPRYEEAKAALEKYRHKESFWRKNFGELFRKP